VDTSFAFELVLVVVLAEALTEALVEAQPLEPVRHWVGKWHPLLATLVGCGFCLSFWVALTPALLLGDSWGERLVLWLVGWRLSGLWHDLVSLLGWGREALRVLLRG